MNFFGNSTHVLEIVIFRSSGQMENDMDRVPDSIQSFVFLDIEASGLFPTDRMNPMEDPPIPGDRRNLTQMLRNHIRLSTLSSYFSGLLESLLCSNYAFIVVYLGIDQICANESELRPANL